MPDISTMVRFLNPVSRWTAFVSIIDTARDRLNGTFVMTAKNVGQHGLEYRGETLLSEEKLGRF